VTGDRGRRLRPPVGPRVSGQSVTRWDCQRTVPKLGEAAPRVICIAEAASLSSRGTMVLAWRAERLLIDGSSLILAPIAPCPRARAQDGLRVNAIRGFEALSRLIVQRQPRQLVVADDLGLSPLVAGTEL
jgi:hypothetical protein